MKILILLSFVSFFQSGLAYSQEFLCTKRNAKTVIPIARAHSNYDKNLHCSVSCMLSLRCNKREVLLAGLFKEILDSVGPGDADSEDFVADKYGIGLVSMQRARTDTECLEQCDLKY